MMHRYILSLAILILGWTCKAQLAIDLETGICFFGYNDVQIPGKEGTRFSLSRDFDKTLSPYYRARVNYTFKRRHTLSALYAPLSVKSSGIISSDLYFQNNLFKEGSLTHYTWKFNSYRLTYQYSFILRERFTLALGLTGKIRDAKIALANGDVSAEKTNVGIVPLIRFYANWEFADKWHLIADGDALVGAQGRAEDVLVALGYQVSAPLSVKLGYRILEGGADNDEVYNFSSVHYASLSATWTFLKR
ncbi:hypothetical protein CNR22_00735 [Sphingobacteriaceae bacterium]|nr:hypothetical protein CNR22_00735 [Sphingobacteriaceae bacterium]